MLAWVCCGLLTLMLVVRLTGTERGTLLVLAVGALPLTLLPAYGLLAFAVVLRRRALGACALALVGAHVVLLLPALGAAPLPPGLAQAPRLRVVAANLYVLNTDPVAAGRRLRALHPDVLIVSELDADGLAGLRESGLLADLPHSIADLAGRSETVGLFSRLPLAAPAVRTIGARALPRATVTVDGVAVRLLAAHPLPPIAVFEGLWRAALADLAVEAREQDGPAVFAGDLNASRDHAPFRTLLDAGLRDAADDRGRGLRGTWPAGLPLLRLDHVLVRDGAGVRVVVRDLQTVRVPGSDHDAVVADLSLLRR